MFSKERIVWGLAMSAVVIFIALINDFWVTFVVFGALLYFAFDEAKKLFDTPKANVLFVYVAFILASLSKEPLAFGALLFLAVVGYLVYIKARSLKESLPYLYPVVPIFALWQLYLDKGMFALFWLIFIVVICDSGAYFVGKLIGATPFSPTSPNKTREGVIGGVLCATILGTLFGLFEYSFSLSLICSVLVAIFAVIGDLLESYFKRKSGVKDSSTLIPGHGGVLDRIDALIIAVFAMLALL